METLNNLKLSETTREMTESLLFTGFIKDIIYSNKTCQILLDEFETINTETTYILQNLMTELKGKNISYLLSTTS